jgi:hypothetical protein
MTYVNGDSAENCRSCLHYEWYGLEEFCHQHEIKVNGSVGKCDDYLSRESVRQVYTYQVGQKVWRAFLAVGTPSIRASEETVIRVSMDKAGVYFELSRVDGLFRPGEIFRTKEEALDDLLRKFTEQIEKLKGMDP